MRFETLPIKRNTLEHGAGSFHLCVEFSQQKIRNGHVSLLIEPIASLAFYLKLGSLSFWGGCPRIPACLPAEKAAEERIPFPRKNAAAMKLPTVAIAPDLGP
jgi:hypothetical protein